MSSYGYIARLGGTQSILRLELSSQPRSGLVFLNVDDFDHHPSAELREAFTMFSDSPGANISADPYHPWEDVEQTKLAVAHAVRSISGS